MFAARSSRDDGRMNASVAVLQPARKPDRPATVIAWCCALGWVLLWLLFMVDATPVQQGEGERWGWLVRVLFLLGILGGLAIMFAAIALLVLRGGRGPLRLVLSVLGGFGLALGACGFFGDEIRASFGSPAYSHPYSPATERPQRKLARPPPPPPPARPADFPMS